MKPIRLGVNIDHVATIRNARGIELPDPVRAALLAQEAGADGITAHLREDRRHISDNDIARLKSSISLPLNFEMAPTEEMLNIALKTKPSAVCIVPERRQEITTEGGLNVIQLRSILKEMISALKDKGIRVSLFVEPDKDQISAAKEISADIVEIHTGKYCVEHGNNQQIELTRIRNAALYAETMGLECHAGHGISFETVSPVAGISSILELNIGHFLIGEAIFIGLAEAVKHMKYLMQKARN